MISTETLEEILRDTRKRLNSYPELEQSILEPYFEAKFELLEQLIEISKEATQ